MRGGELDRVPGLRPDPDVWMGAEDSTDHRATRTPLFLNREKLAAQLWPPSEAARLERDQVRVLEIRVVRPVVPDVEAEGEGRLSWPQS